MDGHEKTAKAARDSPTVKRNIEARIYVGAPKEKRIGGEAMDNGKPKGHEHCLIKSSATGDNIN